MTKIYLKNIAPFLVENISKLGYETLTKIQELAIGPILDGQDVLAIAQTGTGKTAAFCLPIINKVINFKKENDSKNVKALILTPTRELAQQINEKIKTYSQGSDLNSLVIIGGIRKENQIESLKESVDIIVATPGRLLDLISGKYIQLSDLNTFVLDEADMMLDMGFNEDVNLIISMLPTNKQTLLFSATMPKQIEELSKKILRSPVKVEASTQSSTKENIDQSIYFVDEDFKLELLSFLLEDQNLTRVMIFCKAKYGVAAVVEFLNSRDISNCEIHSNITQTQRNQAIEDFSSNKSRVLVATDIASRGIDISDVSHVINFNLPEDATYYVHRIGRTARAQKGGVAISLCGHKDIALLRNVQKLIKKDIPQVLDHPYHKEFNPMRMAPKKTNNRKRPSQAKRKAKNKFVENLKS